MIIGTGLDIIDVERIRQIHERWGERFLKKFLRAKEIEYCLSVRDPVASIAARFAGKEAISKAFGTGIGGRINWHDIEIVHDAKGRPEVKLHGGAKSLLQEMGGMEVQVSLSHSEGQAAAMALLQG
jgi:holo-[acyl-carrier protein] synthase